jgi:hypothetical protein
MEHAMERKEKREERRREARLGESSYLLSTWQDSKQFPALLLCVQF